MHFLLVFESILLLFIILFGLLFWLSSLLHTIITLSDYISLGLPSQSQLPVMEPEGAETTRFPKTIWAKLYITSAVVFNSATIAVEAVIFAWFQQASNKTGRCNPGNEGCTPGQILAQTVPLYLALFLFAGVYQILISLWALYHRNLIQLLFLMIFSLAMLIYSGIQYDQIKDSNQISAFDGGFITKNQLINFLISVPCILGAQFLFQSFLTFKLYKEFNWDIFRRFGADMKFKRALKDYVVFESLVIFDIFFFVGFTLQFVIVVLQTKDVEFALTIAVIPVTILILIGAIYSAKREFKPGLIGFIILCFPGMAYFLYKLIRLYTVGNPRKKDRFIRARKTLTVFAAITVVFLILTIVFSIKVLINFGSGLKKTEKNRRPSLNDSIPIDDTNDSNSLKNPKETRMIID